MLNYILNRLATLMKSAHVVVRATIHAIIDSFIQYDSKKYCRDKTRFFTNVWQHVLVKMNFEIRNGLSVY